MNAQLVKNWPVQRCNSVRRDQQSLRGSTVNITLHGKYAMVVDLTKSASIRPDKIYQLVAHACKSLVDNVHIAAVEIALLCSR